MKKTIFFILLITSINSLSQINIDSNSKAKLYFIEAERNFNQNNFKEALKYINRTELALGETNGRILNLKVKTLYNIGQFEEASKALELFMNSYSSSVTLELKADTESYFIKLERYFENKEKRNKEESLKLAELKKKLLRVAKFKGGVGLVYVGGKAGIIDLQGNYILEPKFVRANFSGNFIQVGETEKTVYLVDKTGKRVTPKKYYWAYSLGDGLIKVSLKNNNSKNDYIISLNNQNFIKGPYYFTYRFTEDRAEISKKVNNKTKYGYIDRLGREVIPAIYEHGSDFSEGLAAVKKNGKRGYINKSGDVVIPFKFDTASDFKKGFAFVKVGKDYYIINKTGDYIKNLYTNSLNLTLPNIYNGYGAIELYSDWNSGARIKKWGIIDYKGEVTYPIQSKYRLTNYNKLYGLFQFSYSIGGGAFKCGLMNHNGVKVVLDIYDYDFSRLDGNYDDLLNDEYHFIKAFKNKKWGVINKSGKIIIPLKYENVIHINKNKVALVKHNGKLVYADANGIINLR